MQFPLIQQYSIYLSIDVKRCTKEGFLDQLAAQPALVPHRLGSLDVEHRHHRTGLPLRWGRPAGDRAEVAKSQVAEADEIVDMLLSAGMLRIAPTLAQNHQATLGQLTQLACLQRESSWRFAAAENGED